MGEDNREMEKKLWSQVINVKANYQEGPLTRRVDTCFLSPACLCFHRKHVYNKWNHMERLEQCGCPNTRLVLSYKAFQNGFCVS